jgi:hypothetical protein
MAALLLALGFQVSIAQMPFWTETFSDQAAATANWVNGGTNPGTEIWKWTNNPLDGFQDPNIPAFNAATASTGYFLFNSDANGDVAHDVRLTGVGNPANCSGKNNVRLRFSTQYIRFSANAIAAVGVSTNGTDFTYYQVLGNVPPNNIAQGIVELPLPEANNQPQVWIQFRWVGKFEYHWKVDDLELFEFIPPVRNITFRVDASLQTVDPGGMRINGTMTNGNDLPMTNQGGGIWSATLALNEGTQVQYKFKNGAAGAETGQAACGVSDGAGGFNRTYTVGADDAVLPAVCFNACGPCTFSCDQNPNKIVCDNFEQYNTNQRLAQQNVAQNGAANAWWTTWSGGGLGGAEDGIVSTEQANSGTKSFKIQAVASGGPMDVLLRLGNKTTGRYEVKWMTYVPTGRQAYYNIQNVVPIAGGAWNLDGFFQADGTGNVQIGAGSSLANFTYPQGEWFEIKHVVDLDNNLLTLWIDGQFVIKMAYPGNLGGINFYGINANYLYYVDDVEYVQLPSVTFNVDFCDSAVDLTLFFGGASGVPQTTGIFDNTNMTTSPSDPTVDCWEENSVNTSMWYTFTGNGGKFHIETVPCNATNYIGTAQQDPGDTQMLIFAGDDCTNLTEVACNDDLYPNGNPDWRSGLDLQTQAGQNYYMLIDGFNFSGTIARGQYCIEITQIPSITCSQGKVGTYTVSSPYLCFEGQLSELITVNNASFTIPNQGPVFGLAWAITTSPVNPNVFPTQATGLVGSTGFLASPFAVGYVNAGTVFPFNVYYITPIVVGGGTDTNPANGPTLFDVDPSLGCYFIGQSTQMVFLPLTDDITATAVPGNGSVNLTPGGGIGAILGDQSSYSYQWSNGATTQDLANVAAGTYTCTVSDPCSEPAVVTVQVTVGTEDPSSVQSFVLSPNPTTGIVTLNLELASAADVRIEVLNTLGQIMQNINVGKLSNLSQNIDLSNLTQGAYFIRLTLDGETAVRRVVLQK